MPCSSHWPFSSISPKKWLTAFPRKVRQFSEVNILKRESCRAFEAWPISFSEGPLWWEVSLSSEKDPVFNLTIYNLFTTVQVELLYIPFWNVIDIYMYIRPSKYLKALRNEFPKFYPHINIIVQKSTENLPQQKFFHCHKRFDNNLHWR